MFESRSISQRLHAVCSFPALFALALFLLLIAACGSEDTEATATPGQESGGEAAERFTLVIGNIDASNPAEKIEEFQPLADYLAANLDNFGVSGGDVVIARDTDEMANLVREGEVDIYIDAAIPSLEVCEDAGCEFALRQWRGGSPDTAGVFVARADSDIDSLEDLTGDVIMLEQPHSTVGHILPLVTFAERDIAFREVSGADAEVAEDEIGYIVSPGGQTSMNMLLNGEIAALALGERAFNQFSPEVQSQVKIVENTRAAPSQLVSFSPEMTPEIKAEVIDIMVTLNDTVEGQAILESLREAQRFEELPEGTEEDLAQLHEAVKQALPE